MRYALVSSNPAPIDVDTAKKWLEVTHNYHDDIIQAIIDSAFSFAEGYTGISFREQSWKLSASPSEIAQGVQITKNPISGFDGITVSYDSGDKKLIDDQYILTVAETTAFLVVTDLSALQNAKPTFNSISVEFKSDNGYLPPAIENAVKMLIAFMYENRGDAPTINNNSAPPEAIQLLETERVMFV